MKQAALISLLVTLLLLSSLIVTVLPTSASTQVYQSIEIVSWGPTTGVVGQDTTLYARVTVGGQPASAQVTFYSSINGELGTAFTDSTGLAQYGPGRFYSSDTITAKAFVKVVGQTVEKSWAMTASGGAATPVPTAATPVPTAATPVPTAATPQATVPKPTVATPTAQPPTIIINVPPTTVINNVIPGTITQGTNNKWGCPEVTVKNPGPDKLRTTILDFAKNPEDNTAHYNEQVGIAKADGWTLTDHGEKTYGDASKDYRYSRFTKGTSTLLLAAQGNNSTDKNYDIPGDLLITERDEPVSATTTSSLGSFLGVPGFEAVYAVAGLVAVAYLVMRRRK